MTQTFSYKIFILVLLMSACMQAYGQSGTRVKITADRTRILIGEPIELALEAEIPENEPIGFFRPDSIPHFEILRQGKTDTVNTSKGTVLTGIIYITSFDSGHWVIPPLLLRDSIYTDSIGVDVGYTDFDVSKPYNDIKDILDAEEKKAGEKSWWWYVAAGAVALLLIAYFIFRKKRKPAVKPAVPADPYKKAMDDLNRLLGHKPEARLYYSELVNIFRTYVSGRTGIESMHQTTADLIVQLRKLKIEAGLFDELSATLRLSDLAKFARVEPSASQDDNSAQTIKRSVELIEQERKAFELAEQAKAIELSKQENLKAAELKK